MGGFKTREWSSTLQVWSPSDLSGDDRELLHMAHEAAANAYAPYSQFQVGGAVRLVDGTVVVGSNQENMAYPSGMCGERVAVFAPSSTPWRSDDGCGNRVSIPQGPSDAFMPCGACRQVLVEAERRQGRRCV